MTPKEKAKEICDKFLRTYKVSLYPPFNSANQEAKHCALIAVDEISKCTKYEKQKFNNDRFSEDYWNKIKQEIEKL